MKKKALTARVNDILGAQFKSGYLDEFQRKFDLLTPAEKEIVSKAINEPYDKATFVEFEKIQQKLTAKH